MNNIIHIDEHIYELPAFPKSHDDVLFVKENNKKNQYWRRQIDFPKQFFEYVGGVTKVGEADIFNGDGVLITISEDTARALIRFRDRELHRRIHGVWIMNFGELTYLTGNHYFTLQWGEMHGHINPETGDSFGDYREFQRDFFYFIDHVEKSPVSGGFIAKAKKTGITQLMALMFLNESTLIREKRFTMMSKSHDDAKDTNMMLYQHALEKMPSIMKPSIKNSNLSKVVFDKPKIAISGSQRSLKMLGDSKHDGFKTFVEALPTKEDAMDGPKIWRAHLDEFPKYKNPYPKAVYDKSIEATMLQQIIYGKQFYTSYPPEDDSKSFFEARKIWNDSALKTKNEAGNTASKLIQFYISALNSSEGTFNRYGKADQSKAFYLNEQDRKSAGTDRRDLQKKKRQYSRTKKEAWESGGSGSLFDNIRLAEQESDINDEVADGAEYYRQGSLEPKMGRMSPVMFTEITDQEKTDGKEGKFRFYAHLLAHELNVPFNLPSDDNGFLMPHPDTTMVAAVDPTDYKLKKDVAEGSKNSITVMNEFSIARNTAFRSVASNIIIAEYYDRPDDPDEFYEDLVNLILFLGCYVIVEANKGWVVTRLKKDGLQNFLLLKDKKLGIIRPFQEGDELTLINTTEDMINEYCRAIARYIRKPTAPDDIDWLKTIKSDRLIQQLMNFDVQNTKKFDMVVSFGYCRMAIEALFAIRQLRIKHEAMYSPDVMEGVLAELIYL